LVPDAFKPTLARAAYSLLLRAALPLVFARYAWRARKEPLYGAFWSERIGRFDAAIEPGRLWLHAVSLGETRAAAALIEQLRAQRPGVRLLLTHGTATGRAAGRALLREGDVQSWLPLDTPGAARRFLRAHRPAAGVLLETEVWPNLLFEAQAAGVPMVLANARLSERSLAKGRRLAALLHPAMARFKAVLAQTEADAQRLRASGVQNVQVMGNLKFDMDMPPDLMARGRQWRQALGRPVVLAASWREGEDEPLLKTWAALPQPRPLLLLVPRHPQRFDAVANMVIAAGLRLRLQRRSTWHDAPPLEAAQADVWLGDSLGEMPLYYGAADVALLGGSFAPLGGQSLIEAAACGCPLLMGPHTFNFGQAAELSLAAGAAERVGDLQTAVSRAVQLCAGADVDADTDTDAGLAGWRHRALAFAQAHRGAAARMATAVLDRLPRQGL